MDRASEILEVQTAIDLIAGEPMICESHPWRLWPSNDEGCAGPGMPLSAIEGICIKANHGALAGGSARPMVSPT